MVESRISYPLVALALVVALWSLFEPTARRFTPTAYFSDPKVRVYDRGKNLTYVGVVSDGVEQFQNIFYAEDTAGANRFAPPVPLRYPSGSTVDATSPGAWCPQGAGDILPFTSRVVNISENCLSLRIARPAGLTHGVKLPVLVWLHGGGHALGSAYDLFYAPDGLVKQAVKDQQPVIYVGVDYRLGIFGFAKSEALVRAKHTNAGLRDQRAAFEWVRDNIAAFGGNATNVTAIGQSVGASDIGLQMTAFGGSRKTPFDKAIMMSGAPGLTFNMMTDEVQDRTAEVAAALNCVKGGDSQSDQTLACLRQAPLDKLANISVSNMRAARPPFGESFFYPTFDNDFIPDRPSLLMRAGRFSRGIPLIASWVSNDGAWYASPTISTDEQVLASFGLWLQHLTEATKARLLKLYPISDFEHLSSSGDVSATPQYYRAAQMNRDLWFVCPVLDFAWQYAKSDGGAAAPNVRLYEHNATRFMPILTRMGVPMWGVVHLSDIPYIFNGNVQAGGDNSEPQRELSRLLSSSIVRFANAADPSGSKSGAEEWPQAFPSESRQDFKREFPSSMASHVFGGPHGSGAVIVREDGGQVSHRQQAVLDEKLFERCNFINSDQVRREIGV